MIHDDAEHVTGIMILSRTWKIFFLVDYVLL